MSQPSLPEPGPGEAWAYDSEGNPYLVKVVYCTFCGGEFATQRDVHLHQIEDECPVGTQPLLVNDEGFIVDGNHRITATRKIIERPS